MKLLQTRLSATVRNLSVDGARLVARNMRSKQLDLNAYETDKIELRYLDLYDPILTPWTDKEIKLLEIGVRAEAHLNYGVTISLVEPSLALIESCPNASSPERVFRSSRAIRQTKHFCRKWQVKLLGTGLTLSSMMPRTLES